MNNLIILLIMLFSFNVMAECQIPVKFLPEGAISPCNGFLFSPDAELKARQATHDRDHYKSLTDLSKNIINAQDNLINTQNDRISNLHSINSNTQQQLESEKSIWNKALYIGLGALGTWLVMK